MAHWKAAGPFNLGHGTSALRSHATAAVFILTAAIPGLVAVWLMPPPFVLPTLCLVSLASAGGLTLLAWWLRAKRQTDRVNLWDVAGACALIGFAAGMLSPPEYVVQLFEHAVTVQ